MNKIKILNDDLIIIYHDENEKIINLNTFVSLAEENFDKILDTLCDPRLLEKLNQFEKNNEINVNLVNVQNFLEEYFFRINTTIKTEQQ